MKMMCFHSGLQLEVEISSRRNVESGKPGEEYGRRLEFGQVPDHFAHVVAVKHVQDSALPGPEHETSSWRDDGRRRPEVLVAIVVSSNVPPLGIAEGREPVHLR